MKILNKVVAGVILAPIFVSLSPVILLVMLSTWVAIVIKWALDTLGVV